MSLNECADCTTAYAIDLEACPHCGAETVASEVLVSNLAVPVAHDDEVEVAHGNLDASVPERADTKTEK